MALPGLAGTKEAAYMSARLHSFNMTLPGMVLFWLTEGGPCTYDVRKLCQSMSKNMHSIANGLALAQEDVQK